MTLKTAKQLGRATGTRLPLGEILYRETSQVKLPSPIVGASGKGKDKIYATRPNGVVVVRPYVVPRDPKTPFQMSKRTYMPDAQRNWSRITQAEREAWADWGYRNVYAGEEYPPVRSLCGYRTYCKMQFYRQAMGRGLTGDVPVIPVPAAVTAIEQVAPPEEGAFAFRVRHGQQDVSGMRLLVELTPAMPTLTRTPKVEDLVWFAENDADAFVPLGPDGTFYVIYGARYPVESGRRFGVRMRLVTEEGMPGKELRADLVKEAPAESAAPAELDTKGGEVPGLRPAQSTASSAPRTISFGKREKTAQRNRCKTMPIRDPRWLAKQARASPGVT